jgi:hypothetical protein
MCAKFFIWIFFLAFTWLAQAADLPATNAPVSTLHRTEQIRAECLQGRRLICGKILKVLPGGLVVDSGFTDLLRPPLNRSWLIAGSVTAHRDAGMVENHEPDSVCVGVVFLTDLPKLRGGKPKLYDYVVLLGYPAGQHTYNSVGTVQKTVRHFSANLLKAVDLNLKALESQPAAAMDGAK